jgi:hypothetical protein
MQINGTECHSAEINLYIYSPLIFHKSHEWGKDRFHQMILEKLHTDSGTMTLKT